MNFLKAEELMKDGKHAQIPGLPGYFKFDSEKQTIIRVVDGGFCLLSGWDVLAESWEIVKCQDTM